MKKGIVYWITGLSGSGKTTLGELLYRTLKKSNANTLFLDGDTLRQVYGDGTDYSEASRREIAMRNSRLCKLLSDQGMNVVCSTISMFWDCQRWNREHIDHYREIYLKVPLEVLKERKNLYQQNLSPMVGVDLKTEEPKNPDLVIDYDSSLKPETILSRVLSQLSEIN